MELEVFVHGALCMAYSGRCLLSGYMNKRDANQGTCTNACRWKYQATPAVENATGDIVQHHQPTLGSVHPPTRYSCYRKPTVPMSKCRPLKTNMARTS